MVIRQFILSRMHEERLHLVHDSFVLSTSFIGRTLFDPLVMGVLTKDSTMPTCLHGMPHLSHAEWHIYMSPYGTQYFMLR